MEGPEQKNHIDNADIRPLRTYKEDVSEAMRSKNSSVVRIALEESEKRDGTQTIGTAPKKPSIQIPWTNIFIVLFCILLLGGGGYGIYYYISTREKAAEPVVIEVIDSLIPADSQSEIIVTADKKTIVSDLNAILNAQTKSTDTGKVTNIQVLKKSTDGLVTAKVTVPEFLRSMDINFPESLSRTITSYMLGQVVVNGKNEPFMVFKVDFFQGALASMFQYESTAVRDLSPTFVKNNGISGATSTDSFILPRTTFSDKIIVNKNTRVLTDMSGYTSLTYSFIDTSTLIISPSMEVFKAIMTDIEKKRFVR